MASRRPKVIAAALGVSAGLSPYLPSVVCPGGACSSCFACVGAGGAAVSALLVGLVVRALRRRPWTDGTDGDVERKGGHAER